MKEEEQELEKMKERILKLYHAGKITKPMKYFLLGDFVEESPQVIGRGKEPKECD